MTNKRSKKRSTNEVDTVAKPIVEKKKKVENAVVQNGQANKGPKAVKAAPQNKAVLQNKAVPQAPVQKDAKKVANKKDVEAVKGDAQGKEGGLKKIEKMKARQAFREKRKLQRKETGQHYLMSMNLSVEKLKEKIKEIEGRPSITKTARRKLAILRKKLSIEEGTEQPAQVPKNAKGAQQAESTKKAKPGKVSVVDGADSKDKSVEAGKKKQVQAKGAQNKKAEQKVQPNKAIAKQNQQNNKKNASQGSLLRIKPSEEVEEESDEEDEDDDEESETELETTKEIETDEEEDDVEEEEDDEEEVEEEEDDDEEDEDDDEDDDEEDDEDEEEDETEADITIPEKVKAVPQAKKQKLNQEQNADEVKNQTGKKHRYVLFVGNLPYTATIEDIKKHFLTKVSSVTDVRIPLKPGTKMSRGFAYVELANNIDYEKSLALDQSFLNGRKINVQYSEPGSKHAGNRKDVIAKNMKLHALRKAGKLAGGPQKNYQKFAGKKGKPNFGATKT